MRRKTGLSCRRIRIHSEMTSSTADSRKGTRQPQSAKSAAGIAERTAAITASDSSSPPSAMPGIQLVCRPRRPASACSAT